MATPETTYTPTEVAQMLNVDPKRVRAYLRANFTRPLEAKNTSWILTEEVKDALVDHFTKDESDDETDEADDES